jgi:hypothetical protein
MKKLAVLFVLVFSLNANAQEISVEKSFFEIQTGFVGLWINNESKLSNSLVLRSELGLEHDFTVGDHYEGADFILQPVLTVEPKYYFNLKKRNRKGRVISKNTGNYFSIKTSYHPDWFVINLDENITKTADLAIVPTWGMRRQIGNRFTYEAGLGLGYRIVFLKENYSNGYSQNVDDSGKNQNQYVPYLHLRIGYTL